MTSFPLSAHIGYLFTERPMPERIAAAAAAGFDAVEHPAPYAIPAPEMAALLRRARLTYTQFGLRSGDASAGEKGIGIFPDRREEFARDLVEGLDYAEAIGVKLVHAMAGVLPEAGRLAEHWECYVENLARAARAAAPRGITIIVEPMSALAVPDYFIATPDRAAEAIHAAAEPNVGLLLDMFHTAAAGLDVEATIRAHAPLIRHAHVADYPGRHEPGSAGLDFGLIARTLAAIGYGGRLGCEYVPAGRTEDGLAWMNRHRAKWVNDTNPH
ncbi:hydroxypyruvate isomerase family protein [Amaricoccus solimangrovi]|uniref:TIM barrel protein n=1 Tax=Amaricoccus solimangrovi TaxID=2589815 RepID=A0A501WQY4_9RHOB|nr:TIM barrel protein [Amaricoccus solimangrovi]TPE49677.1 TIM barrel protein [Amaricoccus solimangrovi]